MQSATTPGSGLPIASIVKPSPRDSRTARRRPCRPPAWHTVPRARPDRHHQRPRSRLAYARLGWPIIPLRGKVPAIRHWQAFVANEVNLRLWFRSRLCNVGLRTGESGFIVVDTDTEEAEAWARALPATPMTVLTGGGSSHRYFAAPPRKEIGNRQGWKQIHGLDVRGCRGLATLPPSIHPETGRRYRVDGGFIAAGRASRIFSGLGVPASDKTAGLRCGHRRCLVRRIPSRRRLEVRDGAVSGQGGHNRTFATACKLVLYFGLGREAAIRLMLTVFNPKCEPPWTLREIEHKVDDALKSVRETRPASFPRRDDGRIPSPQRNREVLSWPSR